MLRKAGLNVVRMNFSHGAYEYHQSVIDHSREAERQIPGRPLAIALDTVQDAAPIKAKVPRDADLCNRKVPRFARVIPLETQTFPFPKAMRLI